MDRPIISRKNARLRKSRDAQNATTVSDESARTLNSPNARIAELRVSNGWNVCASGVMGRAFGSSSPILGMGSALVSLNCLVASFSDRALVPMTARSTSAGAKIPYDFIGAIKASRKFLTRPWPKLHEKILPVHRLVKYFVIHIETTTVQFLRSFRWQSA